jgi:hypothetical protein
MLSLLSFIHLSQKVYKFLMKMPFLLFNNDNPVRMQIRPRIPIEENATFNFPGFVDFNVFEVRMAKIDEIRRLNRAVIANRRAQYALDPNPYLIETK